MSTPIKPPGSPPVPGGAGPEDGATAGRVDRRAGEFRSHVEEASEATAERVDATSAEAPVSRLAGLEEDLASGRIDAEAAVERLVERALAASGVPPTHRETLEIQLRSALAEDPSLAALRKDLERASKG